MVLNRIFRFFQDIDDAFIRSRQTFRFGKLSKSLNGSDSLPKIERLAWLNGQYRFKFIAIEALIKAIAFQTVEHETDHFLPSFGFVEIVCKLFERNIQQLDDIQM